MISEKLWIEIVSMTIPQHAQIYAVTKYDSYTAAFKNINIKY